MSKQAMPIDTQQVVERLTGAGVPEQQARAHASVLSEALKQSDVRAYDQFVTRPELVEALAPIREALIRLEARFDALEAKFDALEAKFEALEAKFEALEAKLGTLGAGIEGKIDAAISKAKAEIALWIVSAGLIQAGIVIALMLEIVS